MAKPIGAKTRLIREAITANSGMGNKKLAELIMSSDARKEDGIKVTPNEVAQQKVAMKKLAGEAPAKRSKGGRSKKAVHAVAAGEAPATAKAAPPTAAKPMPAAHSPVDLIDRVFALADDFGGMAALKRLVDRLAAS